MVLMQEYVNGRFEAPVPYTDAKGEVGYAATSIQKFKQLARAATEAHAKETAALNTKTQDVIELISEGLVALARADLTKRFDTPLAAEYDSIREDFNTSMEKLNAVLGHSALLAQDVSAQAAAMNAQSANLLEDTRRQASRLDGTARAASKLSSGVSKTSNDLQKVQNDADQTRKVADESREVVESLVNAMDAIVESSGQIEQMSSVIEDIAFQTNLLALNASVEAARAGAAGKGFAVVASEVRSLSVRSGEVARQIKGLISTSGAEVQQGVELVSKTTEALRQIASEITAIDGQIRQVSDVAQEQSHELTSFEATLQEMLSQTEKAEAVTVDTRKTADTLSVSASDLENGMEGFQLSHAGSAGTMPSKAA